MSKSPHVDPVDTLGAAYETMYEHVAENLHKVKDKTGPLLHQLVDEANEKAKEIEEITDEDAEKLTTWLKRDLDDVISYLAEFLLNITTLPNHNYG